MSTSHTLTIAYSTKDWRRHILNEDNICVGYIYPTDKGYQHSLGDTVYDSLKDCLQGFSVLFNDGGRPPAAPSPDMNSPIFATCLGDGLWQLQDRKGITFGFISKTEKGYEHSLSDKAYGSMKDCVKAFGEVARVGVGGPPAAPSLNRILARPLKIDVD